MRRFEHHHVVAKSGHGKTTLYEHMLAQDLEMVARGEASVIVMDNQGDFIEHSVARLRDFAPGQRLHDRLVYIDPQDVDYPIQLNVFSKTRSVTTTRSAVDRQRARNAIFQLFTFVFGALRQEATGRQETLFRAISALALEIPGANLSILNTLLRPGARKKGEREDTLVEFRQFIDRLEPAAQEFFATDFNSSEFAQTRDQLRARIQGLMLEPVFQQMFDAPEQKLDLAYEMNRGACILINCNKDFLQRGTTVFGRFFIALIDQAIQTRQRMPEHERIPCFIYIDEAQFYIAEDPNVRNILETARKYRCGILIAHQYLGQLAARSPRRCRAPASRWRDSCMTTIGDRWLPPCVRRLSFCNRRHREHSPPSSPVRHHMRWH